ncbi:MAG: hypothetical protein DRQ02_09995 [Candidatus Latescibacterota bacterium]|nr:MAG: hypothetical protein DRQ02_09995 [Candidatus Latescibacterota bacterium]RKY72112.1 MAG: hypothetical protein DRQ24_05800 [Candidatus Latescibacterota bacterium]
MPAGCPTENAYVERLIRTLNEGGVYLQDYEDFADAYNRVGGFLVEVYVYQRIYSSVWYLSPAEFEAKYCHHLIKIWLEGPKNRPVFWVHYNYCC